MFLRNDKPDPKQQALDNVLMMLVHKKMSAPVQSKRSMKPSYPPSRNGATNFEPGFTTNPSRTRKLPFDVSKLQALVASGGTGHGMFNPNAKLDVSQVQDMRGDNNPLTARRNAMPGWTQGDGRLERPAPGAYGGPAWINGNEYPQQENPAGNNYELTGDSSKNALIQMLMQRMKSGSFRR